MNWIERNPYLRVGIALPGYEFMLLKENQFGFAKLITIGQKNGIKIQPSGSFIIWGVER